MTTEPVPATTFGRWMAYFEADPAGSLLDLLGGTYDLSALNRPPEDVLTFWINFGSRVFPQTEVDMTLSLLVADVQLGTLPDSDPRKRVDFWVRITWLAANPNKALSQTRAALQGRRTELQETFRDSVPLRNELARLDKPTKRFQYA